MKKLFATIITILLSATLAHAGGMVITNSSTGQDALSKSELSKIFLGKTGTWANGGKITVVYQTNGASADSFFKEKVGKKFKKFKKYWLKKVFSGNAVAPKTFDSSDKAIAFVKSTHGAIGYIDAATPPAGVTVMSVDGTKSF